MTEGQPNQNLSSANVFVRLAKILRDNKKESITPSELDLMAGILLGRMKK